MTDSKNFRIRVYFLWFLIFPMIVWAETTNTQMINLQNITFLQNPMSAIEYSQDIIKGSEKITLKPNIMCFFTQKILYRMNFIFETSRLPKEDNMSSQIEVDFSTKQRISPYDTYKQNINLILLGMENQQRWSIDFSFNHKEAQFYVSREGISYFSLTKRLTVSDEQQIVQLLNTNKDIKLFLKGLEGEYLLSFPTGTVAIYQILFLQKENILKK